MATINKQKNNFNIHPESQNPCVSVVNFGKSFLNAPFHGGMKL